MGSLWPVGAVGGWLRDNQPSNGDEVTVYSHCVYSKSVTVDWRSTESVLGVISSTARGGVTVFWDPAGQSSVMQCFYALPDGTYSDAEETKFLSLAELETPMQFLLACGPLPDLAQAKHLLPQVLVMIEGMEKPKDSRSPGFSSPICNLICNPMRITALEWAAEKGCALLPALHTSASTSHALCIYYAYI